MLVVNAAMRAQAVQCRPWPAHQSYARTDLQSPQGGIQGRSCRDGRGREDQKLINLRGGRLWKPHFRPQENLETLELERRMMEFLYAEGGPCSFMRPDTYEQVEVSDAILGLGGKFLQPGMELPVEFFVVSLSVSFSRMWRKLVWPPQRRHRIRNKTAPGRKPRLRMVSPYAFPCSLLPEKLSASM